MSKELTASMAPKLAECAVFVGASGASAAAERGTAIDKALRFAMDGDESHLHQLPIADQESAAWGIRTLHKLSGGEHVETREEYLAMAVPGLSKLGTSDALCKRKRWVADVKSGQVRNYRQQLAAYSLACMEDHFAESWTAHVIYIDQRLVRSYDFTRSEAEQITQGWISEATSADAKPTPNEACGWCANYNTCKAIVRQSSEALALVHSETSIEEIKAKLLANPIEFSIFAKNWKSAEKEIAKPLLKILKERVDAGEEIPGWKVTESAGEQYVETQAIAEVAKHTSIETLILAMGGSMSGEKFRQFCADSGVEVNEAAIKRGAGSKTLRQTKIK